MSNVKLKRPSSARRNIKQQMFSPFVSTSRLRTIQSRLASSDESQATSKPDAILCVLGIDGRYNDGTRELINYLLFGFFDVRKNELERSGFAEETIDDMMFVIRQQSVDIYCNPINYHYLLPYVAHWRNLHFHCLNEQQYEDDEKAEEFKIESFLAMVKGCQCVGVPFCSSGQQIDFDPMSIEKWPIVQAYALEGFGGGGFFTMAHKVVDISPKLHNVYHFMDPVAVETLVTEQLPLFERQWNAMTNLCQPDRTVKSKQFSEEKLCEPLSSYFSHGRVVSAKGGRSIPVRHPFVLFGTHTKKEDLQNAHKAGISYSSDLLTTGIDDQPAHHMICQAVSPRGPLCCTRTYFFDNPITPIQMAGSSVNLRKPSKRMTDARLLQEIYLAVVKSVLQAIDLYSMTLSDVQAERLAIQTLVNHCQKAELPLNPDIFINKKFVEFSLSAFDNQNRCIPLKEGVSVPFVKTLSLTVYDVPSLEHPSSVLGSVSFAESFLESSLNVSYPDGSRELNGDCVNLTGFLPRYISWPLHQTSADSLRSLEDQLVDDQHDRFGARLLGGQGYTAHMLAEGKPHFIYRAGDLYIYEHGIVFIHHHLGAVILPRQECSALYFYDRDSPSVPALLVVCYKEHVRHYLPLQLHSDEYRLIITLQPKTKAYKTFFSAVFPRWKTEEEKPSLEILTEIPEELAHIHEQFVEENKIASVLPSSVSHLQLAKCKMPDLSRFLQHFSVTSVDSSASICSKHVPAVLKDPYDAGSFADRDQLVVMIVCGVPGSHTENLSTSLTALAKDDSRWSVLKPSIDTSEAFNRDLIHASLTSMWKGQHRRKPGQSQKKLKAFIVSPGYTDVVDIVQAVISHPDPEITAHVKIGAVTVCVDQTNVFMQNLYTLPKLLDQCSLGWVNNIALTGPSTTDKGSELQSIQQLLRGVNSDVAFISAPHGEVSRSPDVDLMLSETAFNQASLIRARYLSCPGWWLGQYDTGVGIPVMEEQMLTFYLPLEKKRLLSKLKALKTAHKEFPFTGNIYFLKGRIQLSDSDQIYDLRYTVLSGSLSLTPAELQPSPPPAKPSHMNGHGSSNSSHMNGHGDQPCFLLFVGCSLDTAKLQDWARACAKPKPEERVQRSRDSLTRMEISRVHKEHHLDTLPDGWFYNGTHFVSLAGDRSDTHPHLEKFLTEHLEKVNREARDYNSRLAQQQYRDLFEE